MLWKLLTNQLTKGQRPKLEIPIIWIVIASILSSTIVITLGVLIGIRVYFKWQSKDKHQKEYFNGLLMTTAVFQAIPRNYISTEYEIETSPVVLKIVYLVITSGEN